MLPVKSQNPPESFPFGTVALIAANCAVFACTSNGLFVQADLGSKYGLSSANVGWVTMFAHMFVHPDLLHLIGNMWFLYLFGFAVEGRLKTLKFLILYVAAGLAGGGLHLAFGGHEAALPLLGASAAIMGVTGAALYLFTHGLMLFFYGFGVTPWRFYWVALYFALFDVLATAVQRGGGTPAVVLLGHLGGAAAGGVMCLALRAKRDSKDASDAKAMFAGVKDRKFLSVAELASMAKASPDDTNVILNWTLRSVNDVRGISEECLQSFMRLLPKIMEKESPEAVGAAMANLSGVGKHVPSAPMIVLAAKIERGPDARGAANLYDAIVKDMESAPDDVEAALFRLGMLCETRFGDPGRACEYYVEVAKRYPMGAFGDQARLRLTALGRREML